MSNGVNQKRGWIRKWLNQKWVDQKMGYQNIESPRNEKPRHLVTGSVDLAQALLRLLTFQNKE
jgi:hypothetical protein